MANYASVRASRLCLIHISIPVSLCARFEASMSRLQHNVAVVIVAVVVYLLNKVYNSRSQAENKWISDGCVIRINYEKNLSVSRLVIIYVFYWVHSIINRSIIELKSEGVTLISFHRIPIETNKRHLSSMLCSFHRLNINGFSTFRSLFNRFK